MVQAKPQPSGGEGGAGKRAPAPQKPSSSWDTTQLLTVAGVVAVGLLFNFAGTSWAAERINLVLSALGAMVVLDLAVSALLAGRGGSSDAIRWYLIHACGNFVVALASVADTWTTLCYPALCFSGPYALLPCALIPAIHVYHMIAFRCTSSDLFHHLLFAGLISPMGLFFETGPVQNAVAFFICGLPGGVDYLMLALVKFGKMRPLDEKRVNTRINVWVRSPGLVLSAFCVLLGRFDVHAPAAVQERVPAWVALVGAALVAMNGQYYMQVVVGNTFLRTRASGAGPKEAYNS